MNSRKVIFILLAAALILAGQLLARDMETFTKNIPADGAVKKISMESDISVANLRISTHDGGDMLTSDARYDADRIHLDIDYDKDGSAADIYLVSEKRSHRWEIESDDCKWDVSLSRDYIWDINLDVGFVEGKIDLSGLPMEQLKMDIGASDCRVVFDQPNPQKVRKMEFDAGAGDVRIMGLGYANFEHLSFDGGAGKFVLNFDGLDKSRHTAEIDVGVGEARIELPENYPIRVVAAESWLSSLELRGAILDEVEDGVYETEDFEDADYGLEIDLDIGIGKTTIGMAGDIDEPVLSSRSVIRAPRVMIETFGSDDRFQVPDIPELPALPDLPDLPELTALPALPDLPEVLEFPELPELPALPAPPPAPAPRARRYWNSRCRRMRMALPKKVRGRNFLTFNPLIG